MSYEVSNPPLVSAKNFSWKLLPHIHETSHANDGRAPKERLAEGSLAREVALNQLSLIARAREEESTSIPCKL